MAVKLKHEIFKRFSRVLTGAAVLGAAVAVALLGFISLELAVVSFGLCAFGTIAYLQSRRQFFWEQAANFKFKTLKDTQDKQAEELKALKLRTSLSASTRHTSRTTKPQTYSLPPQMPEVASDDYDEISDTVVRELLHHAMQNKCVDMFVQPIVRLPQRHIRFFEIFGRIRARPGQYLPASRYMEIAEQDNLDGEIDNLLLLHCLKTVQEQAGSGRATRFFINIKNSTLTSMPFMKRLLGFLSQNRALAPQLVFEIRQNDFEAMPPSMLDILRGLGELGCRFSLDHVEKLQIDIPNLQDFKIRFVKFSAEKLISREKELNTLADFQRTKRKLEDSGINVIIEKIETEEQMRKFLDYNIHYGQGYLFGKPDLEGTYKNRARRTQKNAAA